MKEEEGSTIADLEKELNRAKGIDLIGVDPKTLSLNERLRQRRQVRKKFGTQLVVYSEPDGSPLLPMGTSTNEKGVSIDFNTMNQEVRDILNDINSPEEEDAEKSDTTTLPPNEDPITTELPNRIKGLILKSTLYNLAEDFHRILTAEQKIIFDLKQEGLTNHEISSRTGIKLQLIENQIWSIRKKIDTKILSDLGIFQVNKLGGENLHNAAYEGRLPSATFLGRYYTLREYSDEYFSRLRRVDPSLEEEDKVPLHTVTESSEYDLFRQKKKYQPYLERRDGVIYVRKQDVETLRSLRRPRKSNHSSIEN